ncbi:MAG: cytochrome c oxidase subunit [Gaiellaceae bacterium]|nr:cytochrome c oxidase subunit [Gaiellaceae bacterium]
MSALAEAPRPGLASWAASVDHKRVAVRLTIYSLVFFAASGILALLMRSELAWPGLQIVSHDTYNQLFTMHGSGMFYLVMTPLALALGVYFVPLQIGAADLPAPRLVLLGEVLNLGAGLTMFSGFFVAHGAAKSGWTAYFPLSGLPYSQGYGMDLWILGVIMAALGQILLGAILLAAVLRYRAPGMTMLKIPVFSWSMVATCLMVVTAFPALIAAMTILFLERHGASILDSAGGPIAYQHLFWFYGHPVVYVTFFPFVGAAAEAVAIFSRKRFFGYHAFVLSLLAFAGLSMSVWAHHMFATGQVLNKYFALTSTLLVIPAGIEYFDMIGTMIGGRISVRTPLLFASGFLVLFAIGGVTGIFVASPPLDYHVHDSMFVVAHFHYTLFAGSLFAFFAGVYMWFPKVTGALLREGLGKVHFGLMFVGANLTFFPMFAMGWEGMPRRVADYRHTGDLAWLNAVSTVGSAVIALSLLVFAWNLFVSLRRRIPAGNDPWGGHTLEWWTTSPPPRHNFDSLPPITSFAPLLDRQLEEQQ